jgi:DHA1 family inner membrane transport protein
MNPALLSLFTAAFAIGTTEFVPAGLLPDIASDLGVSVPTTGLLVSGYAAGVAVGGPLLSIITSRFPRKPTILFLMAIFVAGHVFCALAPTYSMLMLARVVVALSHGSYFGLMAIVTMSLVKPEQQGRAIAFVFAGISVANLFGVPIGTFIGNAWGWRATFWVVGAVGILAAIAMTIYLPKVAAPQREGTTLGDQFRVLGNPQVLTSYAMIVAMMIGFFAFFTFVSPWLTDVGLLPAAWVPGVLLLFGLGATVGIFVGGRLGDWNQARTLLIAFPLQVLVFAVALLVTGNPIIAAGLVFLIGFANMITNATLQTRILRGAAEAPDLASTLISSVYNIGIAIGAYLGAIALERGMVYAQLPWFGVICSAIAAVICVATIAFERRRRLAPAGA